MTFRFLRAVFLKAVILFVIFNLGFAFLPTKEGPRFSLYQGIVPGGSGCHLVRHRNALII